LEYWTAQRDSPDPLPDERYVLDVGLTVPWLWTGKHKAGIRQARADVNTSRYAVEQEVNAIRRDVETAVAEVRAASDQVRSFQATILPEADLNLRSATEAYQTGETTFLTLLDSQRSLNALRIAYHTSRVELLMAWARLARAVGEPPGAVSAPQSPPSDEPGRLPGVDTSSAAGEQAS
jgi:outer membrane protein TolC